MTGLMGPQGEKGRLQTIKDGMFWTHSSQFELASQMAERIISSGARFCLIGDVSGQAALVQRLHSLLEHATSS